MAATVYTQWQASAVGSVPPVRVCFDPRTRSASVRPREAPRAVNQGARQPGVRFARARRAVGRRHLLSAAVDVGMVLAWAAMIPGLMWLGTAAGF
ncbi:MAG TPA: hypothetical protein VL024_09470 [Castellaniella sp.]|nr:hypothetical protein [Castellaniella sp.]